MQSVSLWQCAAVWCDSCMLLLTQMLKVHTFALSTLKIELLLICAARIQQCTCLSNGTLSKS